MPVTNVWFSRTRPLTQPVDARRVRVSYPFRFSGGFYPPEYIQKNCVKFTSEMLPRVQKSWEVSYAQALATGMHLEKFALLNGSVFSIW